MHDFFCTDPADMNYGILADRVRFFKESREGVAIMCKAIEDMRRQERQEAVEENMKSEISKYMIRRGVEYSPPAFIVPQVVLSVPQPIE